MPVRVSAPAAPRMVNEEVSLKNGDRKKAGAESSQEVQKVVCTCGLCICRKHHCQVHHVGTNTLVLDPRLQRQYDPKSDYQSTFHPRQYQPVVRRGMALPARILPKAPQCGMDLMTITHRDFVPKPITTTQRCKAKNNLRPPRGTFQDITSYKTDFPTRDFDIDLTSIDLMKSTLPQPVDIQPKENYMTTSKTHHKDWEGVHISTPYKELQEDRFFKGDLTQKESVSKVDFSEGAVKGGKPGTSCRNAAPKRHPPEGDFDGNTTSKMIYKLPVISEREPLRLKGRSETQRETLEPILGKMSTMTQYRSDNPGFYLHTSKRWMCPPYPDKLQLFEGSFCDRSEQKSSYRSMPERVIPAMPYTVNGLATYPLEGGKFYDNTTNKVNFQRYPSKERFAEAQAVNNVATKVSFVNKDGRLMKETQHFGGEFRDQTTNQAEFNFSKLPYRVRHSDNAERVFRPSQAKFNAKSVTKSAFLPVKGERAEQCKPLDDRFHKEGAKYCTGFPNVSVYKVDFAPRPFPKCDRCPAGVILQEA